MSMKWSLDTKMNVAFGAALVILIAMDVVSYRSTTHLIANAYLVAQTHAVLEKSEDLLGDLVDAEAAKLGYLFRGEEAFIQAYHAATRELETKTAGLRELTRSDPGQAEKVDEIAQIIRAKLAVSEKIMARSWDADRDAAELAPLLERDQELMEGIRVAFDDAEQQEGSLLEERTEVAQASARAATSIIVLGSVLAFVLVLSGSLIIHYDFAQRRRVEDERNNLLAAEKAARSEAEEANRTKDEFLATLSHELRTPLNAMLGWVQMLRSGRLDEHTTNRALEIIERNTKAQAQLIEDLLDVSRIITGKLRIEVRQLDLVPVVGAALDTVRPAAAAKQIELVARLDPAAGPVSGDPDRLQQVAWNLLSNAVKFTPAGGRVTVTLTRCGPNVRLRVTDTGKGIDPVFLPYVFERFRQADSSSRRRHSGLGLGLAIVRHLVELHGGTVQAESAGEERGASFAITLPLPAVRIDGAAAPESAPGRGKRLAAVSAPALEGLRVLVVDDEADARELLTAVLEQCDAEVHAAGSCDEALEAIRRWRPDVLVSDIGMPGQDGYELIRTIRSLDNRDGGAIPAIALTAYAREQDRHRVLSAGYQVHVPKPVEPKQLARLVARVAGRTHA
jgi:signal transduction histidine kinase/ActR/RegA family two-component response regulator